MNAAQMEDATLSLLYAVGTLMLALMSAVESKQCKEKYPQQWSESSLVQNFETQVALMSIFHV